MSARLQRHPHVQLRGARPRHCATSHLAPDAADAELRLAHCVATSVEHREVRAHAAHKGLGLGGDAGICGGHERRRKERLQAL